MEKELQWAKWKIRALEERLRMEMIRKYGPKSETLSDKQLLLLELEPGVSSAEVEAESRREPLPPASPVTAQSRNKGRKHPGRQELPADLPRVERVITCTPEQCVCQSCGKDTVVIVSADATAPHQAVITVLEAARRSGLQQVTFSAQSAGTAAGR